MPRIMAVEMKSFGKITVPFKLRPNIKNKDGANKKIWIKTLVKSKHVNAPSKCPLSPACIAPNTKVPSAKLKDVITVEASKVNLPANVFDVPAM